MIAIKRFEQPRIKILAGISVCIARFIDLGKRSERYEYKRIRGF